MNFFRTTKIAAGLVSLCLAAAGSVGISLAEDKDVAAVSAELQPAEVVSVDTTVTVEKEVIVKSKKKPGKKNGNIVVETLPGEKLTIRQVMAILKTTRDLSGKNLSGLQLIGINLGQCNLKGIDLSHANLERADMGESALERADLTGANLKMSNLRQSGMTGANIDLAIFDGAIWKDGMVCSAGSIGRCRESIGK
jgi:hypothetical protein